MTLTPTLARLAICVACASSASIAMAQDGSSDKEVTALVQEAIRLGDAGQLPQAQKKLLEAWAIKKTFDIAANLGFVESGLKDWPAAAEHLDYAYQTFPLNGTPKEKANIEQFRANAISKTGRLRVSVEAGVEITLDGVARGAASSEKTFFVEPGQHTLVASKAGKQDEKRDVSLTAGQEAVLNIAMKDAETDGAGSARPIWPAILMGSVAAVGLGIGTGLTVAASGKYADGEDLVAQCQPPTVSCASEGQALIDDSDTFKTVGIVGFGVGGAAAIATLLYLVIPVSSPAGTGTAAKRTQFVPLIAPDRAGFSFSTSF